MPIWLVDFDGKIENLALMRLSTYHKAQGNTVRLKRGAAYPELWEMPDKVYISCIFRWNRRDALALAKAWGDRVEIGGTGVDVHSTLPPEAATTPPDYELYGGQRAIGFISRGCPRRCPWCIVPKKEGALHRVSTAREIVGDRQEALFLDNNFLALDDFESDLDWLAFQEIKVDFNQGLDARLVTESAAQFLAACKWKTPGGEKVRLALDTIGQKQTVEQAINYLEYAGMRRNQIFVYCLIGHDGVESDIDRLLFLRSLGVRVFPIGYRDNGTGDQPATGWDLKLYKKYRRLIIRMPFAKSVWKDFEHEVATS